MHALFEMTDGLKRLKAILAEFPPDSVHWSEAQNRFQFIDRLLTECLGWERPHIVVEHIDEDGGRADYLLGQPVRAVLEAKREAKAFDTIPVGRPSTVRKLEPLTVASKIFREAVMQVVPYCAFRGVPMAIVCNGPQLAIFQAMTEGYPTLEGECYFFDGYDSYVANFPLLWRLLSPEGVSENRAYRELAIHRNPRIPGKCSDAIPEPTRYRYRNPLEEDLRSLSSILLEEIEDNPELKRDFYKECYVPIEANNRHLLLSKSIISSRYKRVSNDGVIPASLDSVTRTGKLSEQFTMGAGSRPIVVIGEVGVGKTSFFENLYYSINEHDRSDTIFISIDLGKNANLSSTVKDFILTEVPRILSKDFSIDVYSHDFAESIYYDELKAFDRSPKGQLKQIDPIGYAKARIDFLGEKCARLDGHLHAVLAHLSHGRKKRIILILDNADQRDFDVQQQTFLIANELAATRNLFVFVALRPSTFYLSKTTGALSAYQNKLLTISPPPADIVVEKRIMFALRVAGGQISHGSMKNITLSLNTIVAFLGATLRSIRQNDAIKQFLSNITGGNTRSVIELITTFCGSPNVDAQKIVDIELERGNYIVPIHEFTKHALLGEFAYFNSQSSFVACNVFDVTSADPREHFLASLAVSFLASNLGIRDNDGFVTGETISAEMSLHGFTENQTRSALRRLASKRLVETPYLHYREIKVEEGYDPLNFHYRATSIGIYHVRFWTGSFSFLDAMSTDTPIFYEDTRAQVSKLAASFEIAARLTKTTAFKGYLEAQWHSASIHCTYYNFTNLIVAGADTFKIVESVVSRTIPKRPFLDNRPRAWRGSA